MVDFVPDDVLDERVPAGHAWSFGRRVAGVDDRQASVVRIDHPVVGDVAAHEHVTPGGRSGGDSRFAGARRDGNRCGRTPGVGASRSSSGWNRSITRSTRAVPSRRGTDAATGSLVRDHGVDVEGGRPPNVNRRSFDSRCEPLAAYPSLAPLGGGDVSAACWTWRGWRAAAPSASGRPLASSGADRVSAAVVVGLPRRSRVTRFRGLWISGMTDSPCKGPAAGSSTRNLRRATAPPATRLSHPDLSTLDRSLAHQRGPALLVRRRACGRTCVGPPVWRHRAWRRSQTRTGSPDGPPEQLR